MGPQVRDEGCCPKHQGISSCSSRGTIIDTTLLPRLISPSNHTCWLHFYMPPPPPRLLLPLPPLLLLLLPLPLLIGHLRSSATPRHSMAMGWALGPHQPACITGAGQLRMIHLMIPDSRSPHANWPQRVYRVVVHRNYACSVHLCSVFLQSPCALINGAADDHSDHSDDIPRCLRIGGWAVVSYGRDQDLSCTGLASHECVPACDLWGTWPGSQVLRSRNSG